MEIKSEADLVVLKTISNHELCQFTKCLLPKNNLPMFRKSYTNIDNLIAYNEIIINERIKNLKNLNVSKNIVDYYGSFTENSINLLFEYSEIGSLFDYFCSNNNSHQEFICDLFQIRRFLIQIVEALIQIHQLGIVHNDLKLENILLFTDKTRSSYLNFKICDFNNSLFIDADDRIINVVGNDDSYTCPFPFSFEKPSFKFDYWCLGLLLLKIFAFVGKNNDNHNYDFSEIISLIRTKSYKRKFNWNKNYFKNRKSFSLLEDLIDKLLEFDYEERINDELIFMHSFFYVKCDRNHANYDPINFKSKRRLKIYKKKLIRLKSILDDLEKLKKKSIPVCKLKKRMIKYVKIINKIKSRLIE